MTDDTTPGTTTLAGPAPSGPAAGPPLRLVAIGLLVAFLDVRAFAVDLLPDVVGWGLVALGVRRLAAAGRVAGPGARTAYAAAVAAAVLGLADQVVTLTTDGARGDLLGAVLGSGAVIALGGEAFSLYAVAGALVVLGLTGVVAGLAERAGDEVSTARWVRLRWVYVCSALPGLAICFLLLLGLGGGPGMVLAAVLVGVGQVTFVVVVWRSFRDARRPWAVPAAG